MGFEHVNKKYIIKFGGEFIIIAIDGGEIVNNEKFEINRRWIKRFKMQILFM